MAEVQHVQHLVHPFEPVWATGARLLVLGTFPSEGSVKGGGYYGNPRNDFWRLMADVFDTPWLAELDLGPEKAERYRAIGEDPRKMEWHIRYTAMRLHRVALWDVVAECDREGTSSDARLRSVQANDIPGLAAKMPELKAIAFTGVTARALYFDHVNADERMPSIAAFFTLPSPSRANATPYARKLAAYRSAFEALP